jgi:hypothetical protein
MAFGVRQVKAQFFDVSKILREAERAKAQAQAKFGAFVRRRMKSSIKYKAETGERKALIRRIEAESLAAAAAEGAARFAAYARLRALRDRLDRTPGPASAAGSPPFAHKSKRFGGKSPLRELIFFSRDPASGSVVIGPAVFKGGGAGATALEKGGAVTVKKKGKPDRRVTIAPRPFAKPAGDAEAAKFNDVLKTLVK